MTGTGVKWILSLDQAHPDMLPPPPQQRRAKQEEEPGGVLAAQVRRLFPLSRVWVGPPPVDGLRPQAPLRA